MYIYTPESEPPANGCGDPLVVFYGNNVSESYFRIPKDVPRAGTRPGRNFISTQVIHIAIRAAAVWYSAVLKLPAV